MPSAFAIGEMVGASGRDVLTAIVAGYEVCCRLGKARAKESFEGDISTETEIFPPEIRLTWVIKMIVPKT